MKDYMPNSILVDVGRDVERPGKFYWEIQEASSRNVIIVRRDFDSVSSAKRDLEQFSADLINAVRTVNA